MATTYEEELVADILDEVNKHNLAHLDSKRIKQIKNQMLKEMVMSKDERRYYLQLLTHYRYVDELDELRYGAYLRYFNLKKPNSLKLLKGGFIVDILPTADNNDVKILCKNVMNRLFYIKMNESILFQKNSSQEELLIQILDQVTLD
jgi:hypothetical protein